MLTSTNIQYFVLLRRKILCSLYGYYKDTTNGSTNILFTTTNRVMVIGAVIMPISVDYLTDKMVINALVSYGLAVGYQVGWKDGDG